MAPLYITELLSYGTCSRTLCSTVQKLLLAVPKSRLKTYGNRAFSVAAPKLWNELPLDLRCSDKIDLFKKHLQSVKTDLFKHRHARRARVIFCDLKAPGGCSTRWTHKGNSFMCTGVPDSSQCHYKV